MPVCSDQKKNGKGQSRGRTLRDERSGTQGIRWEHRSYSFNDEDSRLRSRRPVYYGKRARSSWEHHYKSKGGYYDRGDRYCRNDLLKPPLWSAVQRNELDRVQMLIQRGADIEEKHRGWTPLMKAAEENHTAITKLLLSKRADVDARNNKGRTPLSFAMSPSQNREVATDTMWLLLMAGADPTQKEALRVTAIERAMHEKRTQASDVLDRFPWNIDRTCLGP